MTSTEMRPVPDQVRSGWHSVPGFVRFAIWLASIVTVIYVLAVPVILLILVAGGGLTALLGGGN